MQVVAISAGFYDGARRRVGDIFDMTIPTKDGKPKMPKWVKAAPDVQQAKREAAAAKHAEHEKQKAGAVAASGGKAAKAKVDAIAEQLAG